jgi:glycosyltransferase involved in cell wall biosynthesis
MRRELLIKGLESVLALSYRPIEIIVVDNSPTDEIYRWLLDAYPMVKAIKTLTPLPLPLVRNLMVASSRGKYVVFHDDDSRFSETTGLTLAVTYLEQNETVACLAFRQGNEKGEWNPLFDGPDITETYNYIACAVMFRRDDYVQAGGYFDQFPLYGEEMILSLAFFGLKKEIHYYPHVPIIHEQVSQGRVKDAGKRYHIADIVMTPGAMLLRAPFPDVLYWYPLLLARTVAKVAVLKRRPLVAIHGLWDAFLWLPVFVRKRRAIAASDFRRWLQTRRDYHQIMRSRVGEGERC